MADGKTANEHLTLDLGIRGMTCASCVSRVEKALRKVPGVMDAGVNLASGRAIVRYVGGRDTIAGMKAAVAATGYTAGEIAPDHHSHEGHTHSEEDAAVLARSVLVAALLTAPVFALEMGSHLVPAFHDWVLATIGHKANLLIQFVLTTMVLFGPGWRFFRAGIPALLRLAPEMNALVVLGTSAAYFYSLVATFMPSWLPPGTANVYYEAAAVIVTLILLGRFLEARAKGRHRRSDPRLVGLQPKTARVERDGNVIDIPIEQVALGDLVQVRPGEKIAVDGDRRGRVASAVDEVHDHRRGDAGCESTPATPLSAAPSTTPAL